MRILSRRLRLANVRIQAHCTLDVYGLVAFQILEFAELYGEAQANGDRFIPIRLTQSDMAQLVGWKREDLDLNHLEKMLDQSHLDGLDDFEYGKDTSWSQD